MKSFFTDSCVFFLILDFLAGKHYFSKDLLYFMSLNVLLSVHLVHTVPLELRGGHQIPWSYKWL